MDTTQGFVVYLLPGSFGRAKSACHKRTLVYAYSEGELQTTPTYS